jgi:hypothetical protein
LQQEMPAMNRVRFNRRSSALAIGASLLAACSGIPQAPLVYASRATVGLDVSTASSETPGGSISIGVKIVDYAYVPVAVARNQRSANGAESYDDIQRIVAEYGEGTTAAGLDALSQESRAKLDEFIASRKALDEFDAVAKGMTAMRDRVRSELSAAQRRRTLREAQLTALPPRAVPPAPEAAASAAAGAVAAPAVTLMGLTPQQAEVEDNRRQLTKDLELAQAAIARLQPQLEDAEAKVRGLATDREPLVAAVEKQRKIAAEVVSLLRTDKSDAMSVYGRFNSTADVPAGTASSPSLSANLTAGKIFSTGVASQNLTEAVRQEAQLAGMGRCLEGVARVATAASAASAAAVELIKQLSSECRGNGGSRAR